MKKPEQNERITTEFPPEIVRFLKKEAAKNDTSMSWVVRVAVKKLMEV